MLCVNSQENVEVLPPPPPFPPLAPQEDTALLGYNAMKGIGIFYVVVNVCYSIREV